MARTFQLCRNDNNSKQYAGGYVAGKLDGIIHTYVEINLRAILDLLGRTLCASRFRTYDRKPTFNST